MVLSGLRALLQRNENIEVIGEATDGRQAIELVTQVRPDVVVMDVRMPGLNGIEATRQALAAKPDVKVIALSANSDERSTGEMLRAGAVGYITKEAAYDELLAAIEAVTKGQIYLSPSITANLAHCVKTAGHEALESAFGRLSNREREILQLIAEGKATKQIAAILDVSIKTTETHRRNIMQKLNIDNVAELTKYAIREGLTSV